MQSHGQRTRRGAAVELFPERDKAVASTETKLAGPLTLKVFNGKGEQVGTVQVDPAEFGGEINRQLLHDVVVMHLANQRAGTHSTLRRGEVAGSTKKLFRQKGTGNARVGNRRTNKRRGGGTAKGPKPRDYEYHLPKRAVRAATRMALLSKFHDQEAVVIDELKLPKIKTKQVADLLEALKLDGTSCLIGLPAHDPVVYKSARNIQGVAVAPVPEFNAYDVLKSKRLLLTRAALDALRKSGDKK
jgi:large subunit ribosomal protein L4